jgi:hypothetical protein
MAILFTLVAGVLAASLGALGIYGGYKLSRLRPHKKSEEIQTVFTKSNLD